jgi:hypothetical protein
MVRATASSPSDKSHLRTLSIEEKSHQNQKSDGSQQRAFNPENSDETQQSMSLMTTSTDRTHKLLHIYCLNNKRLTVSNMLLQNEVNLRNKNLMDLNN